MTGVGGEHLNGGFCKNSQARCWFSTQSQPAHSCRPIISQVQGLGGGAHVPGQVSSFSSPCSPLLKYLWLPSSLTSPQAQPGRHTMPFFQSQSPTPPHLPCGSLNMEPVPFSCSAGPSAGVVACPELTLLSDPWSKATPSLEFMEGVCICPASSGSLPYPGHCHTTVLSTPSLLPLCFCPCYSSCLECPPKLISVSNSY